MGLGGKLFIALLFVAFLFVLIGMIVNQLGVGEDNDDSTYFILTMTQWLVRWEVGGVVVYDEQVGYFDDGSSSINNNNGTSSLVWCYDSTNINSDFNDDRCNTGIRAYTFLAVNIVGILIGLLPIASAIMREMNSPCCCLPMKCTGAFLCVLSGIAFLSSSAAWMSGPLLGEDTGNAGNLVNGASPFLVLTGGILYFVGVVGFVLDFIGPEGKSDAEACCGYHSSANRKNRGITEMGSGGYRANVGSYVIGGAKAKQAVVVVNPEARGPSRTIGGDGPRDSKGPVRGGYGRASVNAKRSSNLFGNKSKLRGY